MCLSLSLSCLSSLKGGRRYRRDKNFEIASPKRDARVLAAPASEIRARHIATTAFTGSLVQRAENATMRINSHRLGNSRTAIGSGEHSITQITQPKTVSRVKYRTVFLHREKRAGERSVIVRESGGRQQRVRHFVRAFFQMHTWQDYACFFSCFPRRRNNRDSKINSRLPRYSRSSIMRDFLFFSSFFFLLLNDRIHRNARIPALSTTTTNNKEKNAKNPFLVDRTTKEATPRSSDRHERNIWHRRRARCPYFQDFSPLLVWRN